MADFIDWPGDKGTYRYWFLATPAKADSIQSVIGNYMFVRQTPQGQWVPVYIGRADDLSVRVPTHDRWDDAIRAGATRVMAHTSPNVAVRDAEEADLIATWQPVLNLQLRKPGSARAG
jgi:hypothetical protein